MNGRAAPPFVLKGLFVTGTDTNVGKTVVGCGLLRLAVEQGRPLLPFKPAESGAKRGRPADAIALRTAADAEHLPLEHVCPNAFSLPVAPAAATYASGRSSLSLPKLVSGARRLARSPLSAQWSAILPKTSRQNPLLVEGAGGLLSPYAPRLTGADLAAALGLPILIVARDALGTINHTALVVAECRRRNLKILGILLVATAQTGAGQQRNQDLIEAQTGICPLRIPFFEPNSAEEVPTRAATYLRRTGIGSQLLDAANVRPYTDISLKVRRVPHRPSSGK